MMNEQMKAAEVPASPLQYYRAALASGALREDPAQEKAMQHLDRLFHELMARRQETPSFWQQLRRRLGWEKPAPLLGLYFWGGVGRGKTFLMDRFYQCVPDRKLRMHFHRFMGRVHTELSTLQQEKNPLEQIAKRLADEADVLCFDEFFVSDIGDAMLLGGLFRALFEHGVVLVATSNLPPQRLYENGLQRQQFLPAIRLIEHHTEVVNVDGGIDYRLGKLEQGGVYFSPLGADTDASLSAFFDSLAAGQEERQDGEVEILGRRLPVRRWAEGLVWFDFRVLCEGPRAAADYIEIAKEYHTVLLSGVPQMEADRDDAARRFITLVDEFYDRQVKLIISAQVPPARLYRGRELSFAFERTLSRLTEMQSHDYLASEHRP